MMEIAHHRLANQRLWGEKFQTPEAAVTWMGAVQSQEYASAKWALGQRLQASTDESIEQAFTEGRILRTHVLRPTWHFLPAADIRWIVELTAARVHAACAYMYRQHELDDVLLRRCGEIITAALADGQQLTRDELAKVLAQAGIMTKGQQLAYVVMYCELERLICSGARQGKQFTYALLEIRAPHAKSLPREEALAELTRRYFTSHGPATVKDFAGWSGLTLTEVKTGIHLCASVQEVVDGYYAVETPVSPFHSPFALALPAFDEYTIGYKNHDAILRDGERPKMEIYSNVIIIDGQVVGNWRRTLTKGAVVIETTPYRPLSSAEQEAFAAEVQRYGDFLQMPVILK